MDEIKTKQIHGGRYYEILDKGKTVHLPSVTTIIGAMDDKSWLEDWYKRVGKENAEQISKRAVQRGEMMHLFCENYLKDFDKINVKERLISSLKTTYDMGVKMEIPDKQIDVGRSLFYNFITFGTFDKVKTMVAQEIALYSFINGGYAGRTDKIYIDNDDNLIVADYKSSKKPKNYEWLDAYKMQISAYSIAYWEMTGKKPAFGEIWISNEADDVPQIFRVSWEDIKEYYKKFIELVKIYHEKFPTEDG